MVQRKPMKSRFILTAFLLVPGLAVAQTSRWNFPILDYLFDAESKSIRMISGVPGAASLDGSLSVGVKLERASIAPSRSYALAENTESDHLLLVRFDRTNGTAIPLDAAPATADTVAFSATGSAFAVYSKQAQ